MGLSSTESLLGRRNRAFMPAMGTLYGEDALELVRGEGCYVLDREGRRYLDCLSGIAVTSLGHCHPEVVAAAASQLGTLQHTTSLFLNSLAVELAEQLVRIAPAGMTRVFFCADGSGAIDGAMVAARRATGRENFLTFSESLHGRTAITMAATGLPMWKCDPYPMPCVVRVPTPGLVSEEESLAAIKAAIQENGAGNFAAFILEPVLGNGGILPLSVSFLQRLRTLLKYDDILLIADEMQTGFCRTGRWFGLDASGVMPDLMCVAKALANGLPQGAWMCTEAVARAMMVPVASTFGGNHVAMAAALKVIEIMERDDIANRATELGNRFLAGLAELAEQFPQLSPPRGRGLMIGVPVSDAGTLDRVLMSLRDRGIIAGKTGRNRDVLTFLPPLVVSWSELDGVLGELRAALVELS